MSEWKSVAREKSGNTYLHRRCGSNIFEKRSVNEEDQLFKIENPDHEVFDPIMDFHPQMSSKAIRAIKSNLVEAYDELDVEAGIIVVDGEEIEFESSTESADVMIDLI